jgi:hypothetical protein
LQHRSVQNRWRLGLLRVDAQEKKEGIEGGAHRVEMDSSSRTGRQRRTGSLRDPQTGDDLKLKDRVLRTKRGREMGI